MAQNELGRSVYFLGIVKSNLSPMQRMRQEDKSSPQNAPTKSINKIVALQ